jgi:hypothetical protein
MIAVGRRLWLAVAIVLVVAALAVPPIARRIARHGVAVDLVEVEGLERSDRGLLGRVGSTLKAGEEAAFGGEVRLRLRAHNARPVPAWVRSAEFRAFVGDRQIGHGTWRPESGGAQFFWPGRDATLLVRLEGDSSAMRAVGLHLAEGKQVEGRAEGELEAGIPPLFFSLPFEIDHVSMTLRTLKGS